MRLHNNVEEWLRVINLASPEARKTVKGALEDVGGRHFVDGFSPPGARDVVGDERPRYDRS